jgi:BirA family transcriptional regulator, biotin operon repressor / biotin---[acetyl-CoA-carboxylase] ligase
MNISVLRFDTLGSTNTEAAARARSGTDEGLCIVADEQTAGRGRHGREWISQKGSGLFMSLILRPKLAPKHLTLIPLMAAVAVYDMLQKAFLIKPDIKWPNDVLAGDKKICGVLSEAVDTPQGLAVILGIGINLENGMLPENATSIKGESTFAPVRDEIVEALASEIDTLYALLHSQPTAINEAWKERSSYFEDKPVEVRTGGEVFRGVTCGLEENGALRVRAEDGALRIVQAGDVERVRIV